VTSGDFRKRMLEQRRSLARDEVERLSSLIAKRFVSLVDALGLRPGLGIGLYRSRPEEVNLLAIEDWLRAAGHRLSFPRVLDREAGTMEFANPPSEPGEFWGSGPYGIEEPGPLLSAVSPDTLDLIVVPGVVFGESGERIGMGAGFFDRYLAKTPRALRVALAFDFQLKHSLEQNPWDKRVQWIITESREVRLDAVERWSVEMRAR
jgi:5-formyltetrahydrofolate cyclo-ligase